MRRGDLVTVALPGSYGKPRPAIVVQSERMSDVNSVVVAILSSHQLDAPLYRLPLVPSKTNGLHWPSDVLAEKLFTVPKEKVGPAFGHASDEQMLTLNRMLAFVLGLYDVER
ncbi:type II toxin-antitoxin system PemK/MazF family toxin [Bosea sp. PAMC 26642]|uniref:type II toxin-antitoxin system PemK/MazF family toxin n=1 Tax=Bosea sp. (strain PAMC 26642) TaxID=1792307 RepID=UPI000770470F|nr:type II toxin-antitoxin system PemK/MazF family toxin [Bosea sp. PAMC 26642]AMJ59149.1 growth inhibitor PemK [Bosea sp. PAMC 26642]